MKTGPIEDASMGDVWPAVEPGSDPGDYGSATLECNKPCAIRSYQTLTITYTAGKFGLDDTGAIRIAGRFVHDGGGYQVTDPAAPNYVTATSSNGVPLEVFPEPYAYRPWLIALRITVVGGYLDPGDTITVMIGDTSAGAPGFLLQTIAESAFEYKVSVDACATGQFQPLPDQLHFPIVAGPQETCTLVAPTCRRPGEAFHLGIRFEDRWGNPAKAPAGTFLFKSDQPINGLPQQVELDGSSPVAVFENLSIEAPGTVRITLQDEQGKSLAISNPIVIEPGDVATYWGDLHGQSGETVGIGTIEEYFDFARNIAFLDVTGHQGNDFQLTNAFWREINENTARLNTNGRFILFPGYEWSGNTPVGGDHNIYFHHEGQQIHRSSHAMLADRSDIATNANTLAELFEKLKGENCILHAHVGGRPADVSNAHDPALKTAVEVHSNWGTFEWILTDSLKLGHRIGVVANSDGHKGRPGAGSPGATEFGAYGGLTCFIAKELTRDAIFECMRRRHHYATSGSRMHIGLTAVLEEDADLFTRDPRYFDTAPEVTRTATMGDVVVTRADAVSLTIQLATQSPIERIDIMNGSEHVQSIRTYGSDNLGNRYRIFWQGAEYRGRGRNTLWHGSIGFDGAHVRHMTPINRWNHDRKLEIVDDNRIEFEAVTSGNLGGVDVVLSNAHEAKVDISTNLVSGNVNLNEIGLEDVVLDAGGLERQIRIRRLPEHLETCDFTANVSVELHHRSDNPVWLRVTTIDGHLAWTSPIYLVKD